MIKRNDTELQLPPDAPIGNKLLPHYFIGDDAFSFLRRLMKPYKFKRNETATDEKNVFNYRLSRARRCVESAFGLLSVKWQCINSVFQCQPNKVKTIVAACCLLQNFLLNRTPETYIPEDFVDQHDDSTGVSTHAEWRRLVSQNFDSDPVNDPEVIRETLKQFVNSPVGSLSFQNRAAGIDI